jgi:hypothetical protein
MRMLEDFLRRVARHPILSGEHVFHRFLDNEVSWVSRREDSRDARRVVGREITRREAGLPQGGRGQWIKGQQSESAYGMNALEN